MKLVSIKTFLLFLALFIFSACAEDEMPMPTGNPTAQWQILPLGDSRVEGGRPEFESYRYELWKLLVEHDWDVNFTGSRRDEATYPIVENQTFDPDHEGTGGAVTQDNLGVVNAMTAGEAPNVVLLGIGGNDLTGDIPMPTIVDNLNQIIDRLQSLNPQVTIFLEQIAPGRTDFMTPELYQRFIQHNQNVMTIVEQQSTGTAKVIAVDMATGWNDGYLADEVHYNEAGAKVVAERYFQAMNASLK